MNKNLRQLSVWLAIFAVLLASLAPTLSRTVFRDALPDAGWVEICTIEGMQRLPAALFENEGSPDSPPSENSHSGGFFEHCPFCFTNSFSFGLTPVTYALLPPVADKGQPLPSHAQSLLHANSLWQPNQARAPPSLNAV